MSIEIDSSIPVISVLSFFIFSVSFLFNIGFLSQIIGSSFLEEFDDKKKLVKNTRKKLFDFKTDVLKKMITLIPYFISIVFCYSLSPLLLKIIKNNFPDYLPKEFGIDYFLFLLLFVIFSIGEALLGIDEKNLSRQGYRIYYNRPIFRVLVILVLFNGALQLDNMISLEKKQFIMTFLRFNDIETFQLVYIFSVITSLNNLFIVKWISRYIVLIDYEIYILNLKEKNEYYSFYGMANLVLTLLLFIITVYLAIRYSIWQNINFFTVILALLMMMQISVLAGQRYCFVSMTRRNYVKNNKLYYKDLNDRKRLIDNLDNF